MELRHLRYFVAVAEELSFSRAAERLQIAQPPLSQQIQALEKELKVKLFDRKKRPLQLTRAGQTLLEEAYVTLAQLDQAVHKTQRIYRGELGYLTVGFTSSIANSVLPEILHTFRAQYPAVNLLLIEESSGSQLQGLRDRRTDIIFAYQYQEIAETQDLSMIALLQEPLVVVLPANHPLASQSTVSLAALTEEPFVMPLHQVVSGLSSQIYHLCSQAGFIPKVAQEAIFMVTILGLVAGGLGVSLLPASVQSLQRQGVVYRPIQEQTPATQLTALWRSANTSAALRNFLTVIKAYCHAPSTKGSPSGNRQKHR